MKLLYWEHEGLHLFIIKKEWFAKIRFLTCSQKLIFNKRQKPCRLTDRASVEDFEVPGGFEPPYAVLQTAD